MINIMNPKVQYLSAKLISEHFPCPDDMPRKCNNSCPFYVTDEKDKPEVCDYSPDKIVEWFNSEEKK
jgi:hypothetical protein